MIEWASGRTWQVMGIDQAVGELVQVIEAGTVGGVVLTGPAGVGKTALATAVFDRIGREDRPAERLVATPGNSLVPFAALASLAALAEAPHDRPQLEAELRCVVQRRLGRGTGRLLMVVDDAPLLDHGSAEVLTALTRSGLLFLLATARTGSPLPAVIDGALADGTLVSRTVPPLDRAAMHRVLVGSLGGPVAPETVEAVWGLSGGIPLHARQLVQENVERGMLVAADGDDWRFRQAPVAPPTLVDLVSSRFLRLDEEDQRTFEALCLAQPLRLDAAVAVAGIDLLVQLEEGGLLAVDERDGSTTVRLGHPLFDEVVRAGMGVLQRRRAAQRAVDALEAMAGDLDVDVALRAVCLRLDHGLPLTQDQAVAGARRALSLVDPVLAERLVRAAPTEGFETRLALGTSLSAQGRHREADVVLAAAVDAACSDEDRARAISRRGNNLGTGAGRFEEAHDVLAAGRDSIDDPRWRSFVAADLAYARSWMGDATPEDASEMVATDPGALPDAVRANECLVGAVVAVMAGELADAEALVEEGLPLAPAIASDVPTARELLTLSRFLALAFGGDVVGASRVVAAELERALDGSAGAPGTWLAVRAVQRLVDGQLQGAVADAAEAQWRLELVDISGLRPLAQAVMAAALAQLGDIPGSVAAAAEVDPGWRDETKVRIVLTQAAAWQEVAAGRLRPAAELVAQAGAFGLESNHVPMGAIAAYDAVRIGHPRLALPVLVEASRRCEGPLVAALLAHARALVAGEPGDLLAVASRLPRLGATIGGAEAAISAARRYEAEGRVEDARRAEFVAATAVAPLGPNPSPTLGQPRGLTAREREIAVAAAHGRSSRAIADELGLSPRTVDNHLASVYRKVGISGRSELARSLPVIEAISLA